MARSAGRSAALVAGGILVSRLAGLVRERVFAHYFGNTAVADAVRAALRIPNAIRNLLGEGTLSASFIPVYAKLLESEDPRAARALAGSIAALLLVLTAAAALIGIIAAPWITVAVAPGFDPATRRLTITLVRILFPMSGLLILAAWCLGVLNTHRRFFIPYAAPTLWNVAQIAVLLALGARLAHAPGDLATWLAWGTLAGAGLQLGVQVPTAVRLAGGARGAGGGRGLELRLRASVPGAGQVVRNWLPVVAGAGVVQISSVVETQLGSLLGAGAVASLGYAQLLANVPIALFGVSVAAASLPELSRDAGQADPAPALGRRLSEAFRRIAYFVIPCAFAFAVLGRPLVAALFQTGKFGASDTQLVTGVLAAYSVGLLGYSAVKLLASGFYALGDTRTPVLLASATVALSFALSLALMQRFGPAGVALGSGLAATVNTMFLLSRLERRVGRVVREEVWRAVAWVAAASAAAAAVAWLVDRGTARLGAVAGGGLTFAAFGAVYFALTVAAGLPEAKRLVGVLRGGVGG